jgi:hypothetical protein
LTEFRESRDAGGDESDLRAREEPVRHDRDGDQNDLDPETVHRDMSSWLTTPTIDQQQDEKQNDHTDHHQAKAEQQAFMEVHSCGVSFPGFAHDVRVQTDRGPHVRDRDLAMPAELVVFGGGERS